MIDALTAPYGVLLLRWCLGTMFVAHALYKWWVDTIPGVSAFFESLGLPGWFAYLTIAVELGGAACLILGIYPRYVALLLMPLMIGMIVTVHGKNGFSWRNVQDTTNDPVIWRRPPPYPNYRMNSEYYSAGALIWLAVDGKLRELSREKQSLDDFARAFFGIDNGVWKVKTYTFDDVVATLDAIAPYDWASFLRIRVDSNAPPLDGLSAAGWKVTYTDKPSESQKNADGFAKATDLATSIGLIVSNDGGKISDVRWDGPAFRAGIAPGATLVAINGREYKSERLLDALKEAQSGDAPLDLLVKSGDLYKTFRVDYRGGLKYPHLERIPGTIDRLGMILAPR